MVYLEGDLPLSVVTKGIPTVAPCLVYAAAPSQSAALAVAETPHTQLRVLEAGVGRISPRGTLMITLAAFGLSVRASTLRPATARASRIGLMCSSNIVREDPAKRDSEGQDLSETFLLYEPPDNECMPLPPGELPLHALCRLQAAAAIMPPIMPPILPRLQLFLQFCLQVSRHGHSESARRVERCIATATGTGRCTSGLPRARKVLCSYSSGLRARTPFLGDGTSHAQGILAVMTARSTRQCASWRKSSGFRWTRR